MAKTKLTKEERQARVRQARDDLVAKAFEGRKFEYVGAVSLGEKDRYTDFTGNKGRHGHEIRDKNTGETFVVGPSTLKRAAEAKIITGMPEAKAKANGKA